MAIIINIDVMLAKRKMSVTELTEKVGITMANISILKNGKAKAIRLSTLDAICKALQCQPGRLCTQAAEGQPGQAMGLPGLFQHAGQGQGGGLQRVGIGEGQQ